MLRVVKAFFRSIFLLIFYTIVGSAAVTIATIPIVGRAIAAPICDGTVQSQTSNFSQPNGEFGQSVAYYCVVDGGEGYEISTFDLLFQTAKYYVGFMLVVIWPLLFVWSIIRSGRQTQAMPRTIYVSTTER